MHSTIIGEERAAKLVKFIILAGEMNHEEAKSLLPQFRQQSYYASLNNVLHYLNIANTLQTENIRQRTFSSFLKVQIANLNNRLINKELSQDTSDLTKTHQKLLEVAKNMEINNISRAINVSKQYKMEKMRNLLQQVQQYRWLKQQISGSKQNQAPRFNSAQGQGLKQLIKQKSSLHFQTIAYLKAQFPKIIANLHLDTPPAFIDPDFREQFGKFVTKIRELRDNYFDYEKYVKAKLLNFSRQSQLQVSQKLEGVSFIENFLQMINIELQRIKTQQQTKTFYKRTVSLSSSILSQQSQAESSSSPSIIQFKFTPKRRENVLELQAEQMWKALSLHLPPIHSFHQLTLLQKLQQLTKQVVKLAQEFKIIKQNDDIFVASFHLAQNYSFKDEGAYNPNIVVVQEAPAIIRRKTSQQSLEELKMRAKAMEKSLLDQRQKRIKSQQLNNNLILKLKSYPIKQNPTYIDTSSGHNKKEIVSSQISALKNTVQSLRQELREKTAKINSLQAARRQQRKSFQQQKDQLLNTERAKMRKMRDDYDDLIDQIAKLNNLYEDRFMLSQKDSELEKSSKQLPSKYNHSLRQIVKEKQQIGVGMDQSLSLEENDSNDSLVDRLNLESRIIPNCDQRQYQNRINELEFKNELLTNQIQKLNTFYNDLIVAQNSQCSQLRQAIITLAAQKQQLAERLRLAEIWPVSHSGANAPKLHLFPYGFIFNQFDYQERIFLIQQLESYTGPIRRTRLLYRADPLNKVNIHKYIDGHKNVVLIAKTLYGKLVAGYSKEAFQATGIVKGYGLLFSLWRRQAFEHKQNRAITYDDYFIIFGNAQLRIKSGEFKIFSNFGIANGYYNNRGEKVDCLLGEGKEREVDLSHLEVYALDLEY